MAPINVRVYYPKTPEGKEELAKRVADAHATAVSQQIKRLNCPPAQKLALTAAIIDSVKNRSQERER